MRFHILGLPHTVSSADTEYNACACTQKVVKFGKMMSGRGHEADLICAEHVTVNRNADLQKAYGNYDFFKVAVTDHAYQTACANTIFAIGKRK